MTLAPRTFASAAEGLCAFYEEEISGEAFFSKLASFHSGEARKALGLMASIEGAMLQVLAPMAERLGVDPARAATIRAEGQGEAEALRSVGWQDLLRRMCEEYPVFVAEFDAVAKAADEAERADAQLLLDHEVALLDYAAAALAGRKDSLHILERFLAKLHV